MNQIGKDITSKVVYDLCFWNLRKPNSFSSHVMRIITDVESEVISNTFLGVVDNVESNINVR